MAALIGALRVSLSADTAQFEDGMRRARETSKSTAGYIRTSFGGVGASIKQGLAGIVAGLSVGLFAGLIKQSLEYASSLAEVAQQLGVTTKDLQTFRFAAGQVGVSQEQLETGLSKLTITLGKVAAGAKAPAAALSAIGISADELKGKDTGEAFRIIADGLQKITDRSQRAAVEVAIFGKAGSALDNLLAGGSAALNELSLAAEKLGIVLSDEQIQKADDTADKLEALKTVLSARLAGVVADNADSILGFADSLVVLVGKIGDALKYLQALRAGLSQFTQLASIPAQIKRAAGVAVNAQGLGQIAQNGGKITLKLPPARPAARPKPLPGVDIDKFLAGGGGGKKSGGKKGGVDHSAEDALRDRYQFDQELRRAQMDTLRAQQDLASNYVKRTTIGIEILNAEQASREAEYQYQVALYDLTKGKQGQSAAQVAQLRAQEEITDSLERFRLMQDEEEQRQKDVQDLVQGDFDRRRDVLDSLSGIATTAAERRRIELEILRIAYEQKAQALQNVIDTSKNIKEQEDARRDLANLNQTYGNDRQGVLNSTRGPLEDWAASVPQTMVQVTEALQGVQVQGFEGLSDAISDVITGTQSLKDAFGSLAKSVIADLIRMSVRMLIFRALSSAFPGLFGGGVGAPDLGYGTTPNIGAVALPKMASGGSIKVLGGSGDRNLLSLNGVGIARVDHGERIDVTRDGGGGSPMGGRVIVELRDDMLDGRIAEGANVQIVRAYPVMRAGAMQAVQERGRRSS